MSDLSLQLQQAQSQLPVSSYFDEALFQREIDSNLALATQLQLNATPTWIVGDQLFQGQVGYDALRQAIAKARKKD